MMVNEFTPRRPELDAESLRALRLALLQYAGTGVVPAELEPALARLAVEARAKSVRAEQLLIALKDVWYSIPEVERAGTLEAQNAILQRVVTMCVRVYYSQG